MDKKAIKEQLTELENSISQATEKAKELRKSLEQSERWEPKEPTFGHVSDRLIGDDNICHHMPVTFSSCYDKYVDMKGDTWKYATPLTAEEIVKFSGGLVQAVQTKKKSRYDWSQAPSGTQFITTDRDGRIDYWPVKPYIDGTKWYGGEDGPISYTRLEQAEVVPDWRHSLEGM